MLLPLVAVAPSLASMRFRLVGRPVHRPGFRTGLRSAHVRMFGPCGRLDRAMRRRRSPRGFHSRDAPMLLLFPVLIPLPSSPVPGKLRGGNSVPVPGMPFPAPIPIIVSPGRGDVPVKSGDTLIVSPALVIAGRTVPPALPGPPPEASVKKEVMGHIRNGIDIRFRNHDRDRRNGKYDGRGQWNADMDPHIDTGLRGKGQDGQHRQKQHPRKHSFHDCFQTSLTWILSVQRRRAFYPFSRGKSMERFRVPRFGKMSPRTGLDRG